VPTEEEEEEEEFDYVIPDIAECEGNYFGLYK
jgi:hypothetical protein